MLLQVFDIAGRILCTYGRRLYVHLIVFRRIALLASLSNLEEKSLEAVKNLEGELGATVLAYSMHDFKPASLSEDQISKIQALESELNVSLVAMGG